MPQDDGRQLEIRLSDSELSAFNEISYGCSYALNMTLLWTWLGLLDKCEMTMIENGKGREERLSSDAAFTTPFLTTICLSYGNRLLGARLA